jgi:hypothetical protein
VPRALPGQTPSAKFERVYRALLRTLLGVAVVRTFNHARRHFNASGSLGRRHRVRVGNFLVQVNGRRFRVR